MTGRLDEALRDLLADALADLFGGDAPAVATATADARFEVDPHSADGMASAPRPDDRVDDFAFDPADPPEAFTLSQPPYPGPRRVRLTTEAGDRLPLRDDEVVWDEADARVFTLAPSPRRDLTGVTGVQVLYGVTSVFTTVKAYRTFALELRSGDAAVLAQAEALAVGVVQLNRQALLDAAGRTYAGGDYEAAVTVQSLRLVDGSAPAADVRRLTYRAEVELKVTRALREDEGAPITRIRTTGRPLDPGRPVDVHIDVDA